MDSWIDGWKEGSRKEEEKKRREGRKEKKKNQRSEESRMVKRQRVGGVRRKTEIKRRLGKEKVRSAESQ